MLNLFAINLGSRITGWQPAQNDLQTRRFEKDRLIEHGIYMFVVKQRVYCSFVCFYSRLNNTKYD